MPRESGKHCNDCGFSDIVGAGTGIPEAKKLICRINPPIVVRSAMGTQTGWPTVLANVDWCGKFVAI